MNFCDILAIAVDISYNINRQNDKRYSLNTRKSHELRPRGFFYAVMDGWLMPKAGYQLFLSIQPFANIVANYTCRNRKEKR